MHAPTRAATRRAQAASALLLLLLLAPVEPAHSESADSDGGWLAREHLTGSWNGARSALEERGLSIESYYTFEALGPVAGGQRRAAEALGNLDLLLSIDLERLASWHGAQIFLYGLGNHGGSPSSNVGDIQAVSNIETVPAWKLFEAWIEQELFGGRASVLLGLYDVNSEFDVIPAGGLFAHSSHGMGGDFGNSGRNGPSTFPSTSLAARLALRPAENFYARFVVADGVPGDPDRPASTSVRFDDGDGVLLAAEIGFLLLASKEQRGRTRRQVEDVEELPPEERRYGRFGKYGLGAWAYTGQFDDFLRTGPSGAPLTRTGSHGVYLFAEQQLYAEPKDSVQGLRAFARLGIADARTAIVDGYVGAGAVYRGPIPGRDGDRLGLAVAAAHLGSDFRESQRRAGIRARDWEVAVELSYRAILTPWLSIQPELQYVIDPAAGPRVRDTFLLGGRLIVSL